MAQATTPKRRKYMRIKASLPAECLIDGRVYKASTADLHPKGIGIFTTPKLPEGKAFTLRCRLPSGIKADFKVEERHRQSRKFKNGVVVKVGLRVLESPDNVDHFFKELSARIEAAMRTRGNRPAAPAPQSGESNREPLAEPEAGAPPTESEKARLPFEVFAVVDNSLFQCLGMSWTPSEQLLIEAPLDFPEASLFNLNISDQSMDEILVRVEVTNREIVPHPKGDYVALATVVVTQKAEFEAFLERHHALPQAANGAGGEQDQAFDPTEPSPPLDEEPHTPATAPTQAFFDDATVPDLTGPVRSQPIVPPEPTRVREPTPPEPAVTPDPIPNEASTTNPEEPEVAGLPAKPTTPTNPDTPYVDAPVIDEDATISNSSSESLPELISKCKYKYKKKLGEGGFAEVYLVKDLALDRKVAMKILNPKYADNYELSQRFIAEAQIAAKFHHPNIALVYEVGVFEANQYAESLQFPADIVEQYPNRMAYFTMQYIEGHTLAEIKKEETKLGQIQILEILREVTKALDFAHKKGVVHRDIKPENVMVTVDGQVLVTDFGIAKVLMDQQAHQTSGDVEATGKQTVGFLGTPHYVSPEQAEGLPVDGRSDLYSLGITAYEMLTGEPPFQAERWLQVLTKHMQEQPKPLREIDSSIHPNVAEVIHRTLEKNPDNRFQSAAEFAQALEHVVRILQGDPFKFEAQEEIDDEARDLVKELFLHFGRSFRTIGTYPENHEMVQLTSKSLHKLFEDYFKRFERMDLEIDSMQIVFQRISVYQEDQRENSFCFNLYRDGIRSLSFFRGFTLGEMRLFLSQLYQYVYDKKTREKDSVTLLFQMGLKHVDFEYVDSFYEGHDHSNELKQIETQLRRTPEWEVGALIQNGIGMDRMIPFFQHLRGQALQIDKAKLLEQFGKGVEPLVQKEAARIALSVMERENGKTALDQHYQLMEQIIHHAVRVRNLAVVILIVKTLSQWAQKDQMAEDRHPSRWRALRKTLSEEAFINPLVDLFFNVSREFKEDIRNICRYLDPNLALPVLFHHFTFVQEEWKKLFLGDLCVAITESAPQLLIEKTRNLDDALTATLIHAFRGILDSLPKSVFTQWMTHPGTRTRLTLARELAQLKRPDTFQFLKQCALDTQPRYQAARQEAWAHLVKHHPDEFSKIISRFYDKETLTKLSTTEKKFLFTFLQNPPLTPEGRNFLLDLVNDSQIDSAERKRAAGLLAKMRDPEGLFMIKKWSKKVFGNREFTQYCKQLLKETGP